MTAEGKIERVSRGKYRYKSTVSPAEANDLYQAIYRGVAENIGLRAIEAMTRMNEDSFDPSQPVDSLSQLVTALSAWFGNDAVAAILRNLEKQTDDEAARVLLAEIKAARRKGG